MKKLSINLNSDYKSFRAGFKCELEATNNLIIISGVNGSGKSQLGEIIYGSSTKKNTITNIQRTLNSSYYQNDIILRTFKDNIEIKNFKFEEFSFGILHNLIKELNLSNSYHPFSGIAISGDNLVGYAKKIKDLVGHDKALRLTIDELKDCCYNNNIFPGGSDFDCKIYDIFYRYLLNKTFPKDGYINKEISPWEFLNNVFEDLEFEYHFKEPTWKTNVNYITIQDLKLINKNTEYETDDFNNLSDGEKSIISLTFAILNQQVKPKIMILDEYDATLNPSLTEKFYKILEKYFIEKDVLVIIITHSIATISMAPDYASFYEVFKEEPRIVKVEKDKYSDMQKALIKYYKTEENLRNLVADLNAQIQKSEKKFILFVEGESDKIILENAWTVLYKEKEKKFVIQNAYSAGCINRELGNQHLFQRSESLTFIGMFDFDTEGYNQWHGLKKGWEKTAFKGKGNNFCKKHNNGKGFAFLLPVPDYRKSYANIELERDSYMPIEFLFKDEKISKICFDKPVAGNQGVTTKSLKDKFDKIEFAESTKYFTKEDFKNFKPIFELIEKIINDT